MSHLFENARSPLIIKLFSIVLSYILLERQWNLVKAPWPNYNSQYNFTVDLSREINKLYLSSIFWIEIGLCLHCALKGPPQNWHMIILNAALYYLFRKSNMIF